MVFWTFYLSRAVKLAALVTAAALATIATCAVMWTVTDATRPGRPIVPIFSKCTEDMPCWDCRIMGNGVCGWSR